MRKQYHFRPSPNGFFAWDVSRLIEVTSEIAPSSIRLQEIQEIDEPYWCTDDNALTCRAIAEHCKLIAGAELAYPIILCAEGRVMDGMHRVARALLDGHSTILATRFLKTPQPDYTDVFPNQLPY